MSKTNRTKLLLDTTTFVAFLVAMDPRSLGIAVHEWLTIALAGTVVVHLLLNWSWIVEVTKRLFAKGKGLNGSRVNYILNWAMFFDGVMIMLSGLMISRAVMPALGLSLPENFSWRGLHSLSTNLFMLGLGLHIALHWNWIVSTAKRLFTPKVKQVVPVNISLDGKDVQA
jgi:hypothetical protein